MAEPPKRGKRILAGLAILVAVVLIWGLMWIRLPRSFAFIGRFDGHPIPFALKMAPNTERLRKEAAKDTICYGFKSDPRQVMAAMTEELLAYGWKRFELGEDSDSFFRGETRNSNYKGMPTQEFESLNDFATFISDRSMLDIPPDVTCVAILTKKSNLAEVLQRFRQKSQQRDGTATKEQAQ